MLITQTNLASTYRALGRNEETLRLRRDVYSGTLKLKGEQHSHTLHAANNYAFSLAQLKRSGEAKALLRRTIPVARRALGENNGLTLKMRWIYAKALYDDPAATLDDLRESVTTLEELERTARRVFGGEHPNAVGMGNALKRSRATLRARETQPPPPLGCA